jgi:hypothetical protein
MYRGQREIVDAAGRLAVRPIRSQVQVAAGDHVYGIAIDVGGAQFRVRREDYQSATFLGGPGVHEWTLNVIIFKGTPIELRLESLL